LDFTWSLQSSDYAISGNISMGTGSSSTSLLTCDKQFDGVKAPEDIGSKEDIGCKSIQVANSDTASMGRCELASLQSSLESQMRRAAQQRDYTTAASIQSQVRAYHAFVWTI
jgi:hypothetical protein